MASRPLWQQELLSLPPQQLVGAQNRMPLILQQLDLVPAHLLSPRDLSAADTIDIRSSALQAQLQAVVDILLLNGTLCTTLKYYMDTKIVDTVDGVPLLFSICIKILAQDVEVAKNRPEIYIPMCNAALVVMQFYCYHSSRDNGNKAIIKLFIAAKSTSTSGSDSNIRTQFNFSLLRKCEELLEKTLGNPRLEAQCNEYLAIQKPGYFPFGIVSAYLKEGVLTSQCFFIYNEFKTKRIGMNETVEEATKRIQYWMASLSTESPGPIYLECNGIHSMQYRCQVLFRRFKAMKVSKRDPLYMKWGELAFLYVSALKTLLTLAKKEELIDVFTVTEINRALLKVAISGMSKSSFKEVQEIVKEIEASVEACTRWTPPLWGEDIQQEVKAAKEWLAATARGDMKKKERCCAFCGTDSTKLLRCSACNCAFYCSADCQRGDWKEHKKECKELQRGKRDAE